jgi:hypothetical protein
MDQAPAPTLPDAARAPGILLPSDRSQWPQQARQAYHQLLRELDRWCRQHDWPMTSNTAVAEEAVRQAW